MKTTDLLLVIDMQNDFVTGPLGTKEAEALVKPLADFIKNFKGHKIYTKDTHDSTYLNTQEGTLLPIPHCMKGYRGHDLVPEIQTLVNQYDTILEKPTFGCQQLLTLLRNYTYENIYLAGVCTGICILANAVLAKTASPESNIYILSDLCADTTPEDHTTALKAMSHLQMQVITADPAWKG